MGIKNFRLELFEETELELEKYLNEIKQVVTINNLNDKNLK